MRKTLVFRLVALKVLVISAVSLGCGGEVANAHFDPEDPFNPTQARELLNRTETYAQLIHSWELGFIAYTERAEPLRVHRLTAPSGLAPGFTTIADNVDEAQPVRVTDAVAALLSELRVIRELQRNRIGDTLEAFTGGDDRLMGDVHFLHRSIQGILAVRVLQRHIVAIETAGATALPENHKKLNLLTTEEIEAVRREVMNISTVNGPQFHLADRSAIRAEPSALFTRLAKSSYHHNGTHVGFQRILLRYMVLTKRLGIADHPDLPLLLTHIDSAREHAQGAKPELPYPWQTP